MYHVNGSDKNFTTLKAAIKFVHVTLVDNDDAEIICHAILDAYGMIVAVVTDDANGLTDHVF